MSAAVINYLLKTPTSCVCTPEEHLAKYEEPFDVTLAAGESENILVRPNSITLAGSKLVRAEIWPII